MNMRKFLKIIMEHLKKMLMKYQKKMIFCLILTGKELNNYLNLRNLNLVKLFLITDTKLELKKRLLKRNQNTKSEVEKRLKSFDVDIKHWLDYDYILINKNLETCFKQIEQIINSHKCKIFCFKNLSDFIIMFWSIFSALEFTLRSEIFFNLIFIKNFFNIFINHFSFIRKKNISYFF